MKVHVLRVFTDAEGKFGNPLGIVENAASLDVGQRQAIAAALGFSETVFIENVDQARLRIHTPAIELPLAGHPLVGAAWLLAQLAGYAVPTLRPALAQPVDTWLEDGRTWIRASVADAPDWQFVQLASPAEVEALMPEPQYDHHSLWAWEDEGAGILRARVLAPAFGVPEDEATGSAALILTTSLGRPISIHQGAGSWVNARPAKEAGRAEIGGFVVQDADRAVTTV